MTRLNAALHDCVWAMPDGPGFRRSAIEPLRVSPVPASIPIAELRCVLAS